jgi:hypothetical protein
MAIEINGFSILLNIGSHPDSFPNVAMEAKKAARTLVLKQLKAKSAGLKSARDVCQVTGHETFDLLVDGMTDPEVKSILGKLDKHHPEFKTSNASWRRQQLRALARGSAEPTAKPVPKPKSKRAAKGVAGTEEASRLSSAAMAAVRKRRD